MPVSNCREGIAATGRGKDSERNRVGVTFVCGRSLDGPAFQFIGVSFISTAARRAGLERGDLSYRPTATLINWASYIRKKPRRRGSFYGPRSGSDYGQVICFIKPAVAGLEAGV